MEGRIIQVLVIGGIIATIGGSLLCEFYIEPWYRQWRTRRRHRHAAHLLKVYRSLRRKFIAWGLEEEWADLARPRGVPAGRVEPDASAVMPVMPFDSN